MSEENTKTVKDDAGKWMSIYQNAVSEVPESITEEIKTIQLRYETIRFVDAGASKEIFEVKDHMTARHVAMAHPLDNSSDKQIEKFFQEGRLHSSLEHPNIIPVYDYGIRNDRPFFTMKLIGGNNLKKHLNSHPELSIEERLDIFTGISNAVSYCHSIGVIHCDLKPENVQISNYGEVLVCDINTLSHTTSAALLPFYSHNHPAKRYGRAILYLAR
jgi:serine/threonine protein kinase